jgi:hypothetical protein
MAKKKAAPAFFLSGKTREEIAEVVKSKGPQGVVDIIFSLVSLDRLLSASEIAERCGVPKREVLADMKAGRFHDPILGAGFFARSFKGSSYKVSTGAVNEWRRSWFVPARGAGDPLPSKKKAAAAENGDGGKSAGQKALDADRGSGPEKGSSLIPIQEVHLASEAHAVVFADDGPRPGSGGEARAAGVRDVEAGGLRATGELPEKFSSKEG